MIPKTWRQSTVGEMCDLIKGSAPISKTAPGPYPLVTTGEDHRTADHFQLETSAVCVPMISSTGHGHASLKRIHYIEGKFALANLLVALLVRDSSHLSPRFLHAYLSFFKDQLIVPLMVGAANMSLTPKRLATVPIAFPSLQDQRRIITRLDEINGLRTLRANADQHSKDLIRTVFLEMFGRNTALPPYGEHVRIEEIAAGTSSIRTGPFGSHLLHSEFVPEGIPVLGIDNVVENEFRWTSGRCVTPEKYQHLKRFRVFPRDVLVTIMGTVGKVCVAPDDLVECISTKHLCVITVDQSRVDPLYLWGALRFDTEVRQQTRAGAGGAIMEGWNSQIIKNLRLTVPPLVIQREFADRVGEIHILEANQTVCRQRLEELSQSVLQRAFQGEL